MAAQVQNLGLSNDGSISMDKERSLRLHDTLGRIIRHVKALEIASKSFPHIDLSSEDMDPQTAVRALCRPVLEDFDLVYLMIENEEEPLGGSDE